MHKFSIAKLPKIEFGRGKFAGLADMVAQYGQRVLLVTGGKSFRETENWNILLNQLEARKIHWQDVTIAGEPSPVMIDDAVSTLSKSEFDVVVGIGGGSPLDAAKAIAGLLKVKRSVMDYLEGVGPELPYQGPVVPLIAVPTTAGTGSEATKNAVLSTIGEVGVSEGFKKSFRHEKLVADIALVDPALLASCPPALIAANGMDAITQLIESFVSIKANVFTDSLAWQALDSAGPALVQWYNAASGIKSEPDACIQQAQDKMAYAALVSGITLAQVGLGSVHGLASPMGAYYPIPHGVVCGTLLATATEVNIDAMREREPNNPALKKYAQLATLLARQTFNNDVDACNALTQTLAEMSDALQLPGLSQYGVKPADLDHIVANSRGSSMQTNPIVLTDAEIKSILQQRL